METNQQQTAIAKNLKRVMDDRGLNALQLSMDSRVGSALIGRILNGKTKNPQIHTLQKLATALEITVNDLLVDGDPVEGRRVV